MQDVARCTNAWAALRGHCGLAQCSCIINTSDSALRTGVLCAPRRALCSGRLAQQRRLQIEKADIANATMAAPHYGTMAEARMDTSGCQCRGTAPGECDRTRGRHAGLSCRAHIGTGMQDVVTQLTRSQARGLMGKQEGCYRQSDEDKASQMASNACGSTRRSLRARRSCSLCHRSLIGRRFRTCCAPGRLALCGRLPWAMLCHPWQPGTS